MSTSIAMIETVARHLGEMREEVVFVGGAVTELLISDPAVREIRPTTDVDLIIDIATAGAYARLEERLRAKGFVNMVGPDVPICRWRVGEVVADVMPTLPDILGFSNRWYSSAVRDSSRNRLPSGTVIQLVRPTYFIATKIEAFLGRGNGDYLMSHDIEDVITLIDGRPELANELTNAPADVQHLVRSHMGRFLLDNEFRTAVLGYLPTDAIGQARFNTILERVGRLGPLDT